MPCYSSEKFQNELTCAALSSKPLRTLSKTLSHPSNAFAKSQEWDANTEAFVAAAPFLNACIDVTNEVRKGSNSLTNSALIADSRSSTYVS